MQQGYKGVETLRDLREPAQTATDQVVSVKQRMDYDRRVRLNLLAPRPSEGEFLIGPLHKIMIYVDLLCLNRGVPRRGAHLDIVLEGHRAELACQPEA